MRADESRGRCSINDSAATLLHYLQNLVLHAEPYAAQIHRYYAIEVFLGFVGDASDFAADSRVVKGIIEPPPGFDRDRNERLDVRPTRNVAIGEIESPPVSVISFTVSLPPSSTMSATSTLAPSRAKASAAALPIPEAPPVTSDALP
jgi:hypothetical protein